MRKNLCMLAALSLALTGCSSSTPMDDLGGRYLNATFTANPVAGANAGMHIYDGLPPRMTQDAYSRLQTELHAVHAKLPLKNAGQPVSPEQSLRARSLAAAIDADLFGIEVFRSYKRNPMAYASAIDASLYAKRNFAPKTSRLLSAASLLEGAPGVVAAAKDNLDTVLPKVYITTAMAIARGQADFAQKDLVEGFADVPDPALQARLRKAADTAAAAMRGYADWLETERLPRAIPDFAIGRDAFVRMLRGNELLSQTPEEILAIGMAELDRQQRAFTAAAAEIDPARPAVDVWLEVQRDHPTPATLIPDAKAHLEQIRSFFAERGIVRYPTSRTVLVEETPRFLRATTFASMDSPGPFETKATESFYYITPTEPEWDAKRVDDWLTAFNYYTTDIVSIHEAYPGHFVQGECLRTSSMTGAWRSIGSYCFVEGWAHYCEQMAMDEGFPPPSLSTAPHAKAKYRMAQASEALLRCCRLVCSVKMHCQGMTLDEATKFFVDNCHYTEPTAKNEAERGSYDPGYCFYTIGKLQFFKLRDDWKKQEGANYSLKRFHEEALKHGMPPLRLLREYMLKDASLWEKSL